MTEETLLRGKLGAEAAGKQFVVMNNADDDFPKGTVVTCDALGEYFSSDSETEVYMYSDVLLKPVGSGFTFTELAGMLPELEVGTEFKTGYGSVLYVGAQQKPPSSNKFLYWKSNNTPVAVTSVTVGAIYKEIQKEPVKPQFLKIDWKEAFQLVADGETVYADDDKSVVNKYTNIRPELYCDDLEDLLEGTDWFKKTE